VARLVVVSLLSRTVRPRPESGARVERCQDRSSGPGDPTLEGGQGRVAWGPGGVGAVLGRGEVLGTSEHVEEGGELEHTSDGGNKPAQPQAR
jgi:hypothetical protein